MSGAIMTVDLTKAIPPGLMAIPQAVAAVSVSHESNFQRCPVQVALLRDVPL